MFRKLIQATAIAALTATPVLASAAEAQSRHVTTVVKHRPHGTTTTTTKRTTIHHQQQRQPSYKQWRKGQRFDRREARNYRVVDYRQYRGRQLYAPPRGQQWVQSGNDAVLISIASGVIAAVMANALR